MTKIRKKQVLATRRIKSAKSKARSELRRAQNYEREAQIAEINARRAAQIAEINAQYDAEIAALNAQYEKETAGEPAAGSWQTADGIGATEWPVAGGTWCMVFERPGVESFGNKSRHRLDRHKPVILCNQIRFRDRIIRNPFILLRKIRDDVPIYRL